MGRICNLRLDLLLFSGGTLWTIGGNMSKWVVMVDHSEYEYFDSEEHADEVVCDLRQSQEFGAAYRQGIYDIYVKEIEE